MWYVYAIVTRDNQSYVGSSEDPDRRLREHNAGKCTSTAGKQWKHVFVLPVGARNDAYLIERWLKVGNTTKKRQSVRLAIESLTPEGALRLTLYAAQKWQENRSNTSCSWENYERPKKKKGNDHARREREEE